MLDVAYTEFNTLQAKIQKLESQLTTSRMTNLEYEDLKEEHTKFTQEYEDYKTRAVNLTNENQQLRTQLTELQDKLRESNFHRQQLQKRIGYLEELNTDLQIVADANKKLESQLKRIGELESMLNIVAEEKAEILRRQGEDE
jgi:FtsZ-binding cell division protein ZapB